MQLKLTIEKLKKVYFMLFLGSANFLPVFVYYINYVLSLIYRGLYIYVCNFNEFRRIFMCAKIYIV